MRGFTLMELLIVIFIMGVLLTLALPSLGVFRSDAMEKEQARNVLAAMRLARNSAVRSNLEFQLVFDLDTRRYWLEQGDLASNSSKWNRVREFGSFPAGVNLATGANCDNLTGDDTIQFNPNGTCGWSGSASSPYICILDSNKKKKYRTGTPYSSTGRSIINRWDGSDWD